MADERETGIDPLEDVAPRPATFAQRRAIAVVGGLMLLAAAALLVLALGGGATPVPAADEMKAAAHARPAGELP